MKSAAFDYNGNKPIPDLGEEAQEPVLGTAAKPRKSGIARFFVTCGRVF
jgi:hypothetical protein